MARIDAVRRLFGRAVHVVRVIAAGLLAGVVAGALAGLGSRLAMFVVRLMNPSHNGEVTHANAAVGRITADGTLALVMEGVFYGIPGAVVYLVVRRWIPWDGLLKGLAFGCVLLIVAGSAVLDGNYEYFRYVSTWVSVGLFALLYPLYGLVVAPLTERLGHGAKGPPRNVVVAWSGYLILGGILLWSLGRDYTLLRDVFRVFP
ncbi:MAG: hypothetical protein M3378_09710 [Actinomycetota bacterium]|nr:hypothetical protein [Actinomycetota bacterium]